MNKKYKLTIKENKGFTTMDIAIGIIVMITFVGLMTSLFYNLYMTTTAKNRNAIATNCIIDVIEEIKTKPYEQIDHNQIEQIVKQLEENDTIPKGYNVSTQLQKYNEIEGNRDKVDLIKILNVTVEYTIQEKVEKIEVSTLITK